MREEPVIDHCGLVAVAPFRTPRPGGGVLHHGDLEAPLEKIAHMGFDAHVREHAAKDDLLDTALAQMQDHIVGLWPEYLVWAADDRLAVLDIGLEAGQPVGTRVCKPLQGQRTLPCECVIAELIGLERAVEEPGAVGWIEI